MIRAGQPSLTALPRPGHGPLLIFAVMMSFGAPLAADELLQQGQWKGKYRPADLGDGVKAIFCVQPGDTDNADKPPWEVTMQLDLPSPGDEAVTFEFQETGEDEPLKFRFKLLDSLRECQFKSEIDGDLVFECKLLDSQSDKTASLTMKRDIPQPDDTCLPE